MHGIARPRHRRHRLERLPGRTRARLHGSSRTCVPAGVGRLRHREVGNRRVHVRQRFQSERRRCGQHGRVPADQPPLDRRHLGRRIELRVLRPARGGGHQGAWMWTSSWSRTAPTCCRGWAGCSARAPSRAGRHPGSGRGAVRELLGQRPGRRLRHGGPPAHARVRDDAGAAGRDRRRCARVRRAQPARRNTATRSPSTTSSIRA